MAVYIVGHGMLESSQPGTYVSSRGSITFFTELGNILTFANGMTMANVAESSTGWRYEAGSVVPNYRLAPLTDAQMARMMTVESPGARFVYVGSEELPVDETGGVHLCAGGCPDADHQCTGVFGRFPAEAILYLACTHLEGTEPVLQREYGATGSTEVQDHYDALVRHYLEMSEEDAATALLSLERAGTPECQEQLAILLAYPDLYKIAYKSRMREFLADVGEVTFASYFATLPAEEQAWLREVPEIAEQCPEFGS